VIEHCLDKLNGRASQALDALDGVLELDSETRSLALDYCRSSARI
jgi:1-deoxy-D-xylulose-5-phosphate reductoisomerase